MSTIRAAIDRLTPAPPHRDRGQAVCDDALVRARAGRAMACHLAADQPAEQKSTGGAGTRMSRLRAWAKSSGLIRSHQIVTGAIVAKA